jgi:hypothetical protein
VFLNFYSPAMYTFKAAKKAGKQDELLKELDDLMDSVNASDEGMRIPAAYLRVTVNKK